MRPPTRLQRPLPPKRGWLGGKPARPTAEQDQALLVQAAVRGRWAFGSLAAAMVIIVLKASWVMAVPDERLEARGREQFRFAVDLRGRRGALLDRNGRVLASTVNLPALYANPTRLPPAELEACFDLQHHFRHVDLIFARVFGEGA